MNWTLIISAGTAFIIGLAASVIAAVVEAKGQMPGGATWIVCLIGAAAIAAKDIRSLLKLPPVDSNGGSKIPIWLLIGALSFGVIGFTSGCGSTPEKIVYNASKGSSLTVEAAMAAWNDYVGLGKATLDEERAVKAAFEKYQAAQIAVLNAAITMKTVKDAQATDQIPIAQAKFNAAIAGASTALADFLSLLRKFNVIQN